MRKKSKNRMRIDALRADALNREVIDEADETANEVDQKKRRKIEKFLFLVRANEEDRKKRRELEKTIAENEDAAWFDFMLTNSIKP